MSGPSHDDFNEDASRRSNTTHYNPRHPIPTIAGYQERKEERKEVSEATVPEQTDPKDLKNGESGGFFDSAKRHLHIGGNVNDKNVDEQHPYQSRNRNLHFLEEEERKSSNDHRDTTMHRGDIVAGESDKGWEEGAPENGQEQSKGNGSLLQDTSEAIDNTLDPKAKRKNMKKLKRDSATREVTDPVTHLKVLIHDTTDQELRNVPENEPPAGSLLRTATGASTVSKSQSEMENETHEQQAGHRGMEKLFPPPEFDAAREEINKAYNLAIVVGLGSLLITTMLLLSISHLMQGGGHHPRSWSYLMFTSLLIFLAASTAGITSIWALQGWLKNRINSIFEDETWQSARKQEQEAVESPIPESTQWLNSILSSIWPLVNPDLFASLADTVEDVMQASLPKLVRMVSVEDIGQGSESIRILGVRWLPTGAAAKSVSEDGQIKSSQNRKKNDRKVPGLGEIEADNKPENERIDQSDGDAEEGKADDKQKENEEQSIAEGMEAEEGDFVNVEVGFSYRASTTGKSLKTKSKNAHLFLAFYLPGGIRFRKLPSVDSKAIS